MIELTKLRSINRGEQPIDSFVCVLCESICGDVPRVQLRYREQLGNEWTRIVCGACAGHIGCAAGDLRTED